jgi:hypothetical protein
MARPANLLYPARAALILLIIQIVFDHEKTC